MGFVNMLSKLTGYLRVAEMNQQKSLVITALPILIGIGAFFYPFCAYLFYFLPPKTNTLLFFLLFWIGATGFFWYQTRSMKIITAIIITGWFFLPMLWFWRGFSFNEGFFMGFFPLNDGYQYLTDAYRLINGLNFNIPSTRRPIYTGLLAFLLLISKNNLQLALAAFAINTGLSIYVLANEVRKWMGALSAGLVCVILFYCYQSYEGQILTENIGLGLGALALAILLNAARIRKLHYAMLGALILSVALNARAGAFLCLPALIAWGSFLLIKEKTSFSLKAFFFITLMISLGFALNLSLTKLIGSSNGALFSNFGYTLYGIAAGYKGWSYIRLVEPNQTETQSFMLALNLISQNPSNLFYGIFRCYRDFFTPSIMFSYMDFGSQQSAIGLLLFVFTLIGIARMWISRKDLRNSLTLLLFMGILLSVSFIPPIDSGIRAMTATMPVNALIAAFVFSIHPQLDEKIPERRFFILDGKVIYAVVIITLCTLGPWLVKTSAHIPDQPLQVVCPEGYEPIDILISPGSNINIQASGSRFGLIPNVREKDITARFKGYSREDFPYFLEIFQGYDALVKSLKAGETIAAGINLREFAVPGGPQKLVFLVIKTQNIAFNQVNHICGRLASDGQLKGSRFYYDVSVNHNE